MALELLRFPGFKDGDKSLSVAVTASYVGGQALAAVADGVSRSLTGNNVVGLALNDKSKDTENGKVGMCPLGSEGILRASLSPTLDKLIITSGVSVGDASLGNSNNGLYAAGLPITVSNPAQTFVDPTDLGVTKSFPYDSTKTYAAGELMYVNVTTGLWTNDAADAGATPRPHGNVISKVGEALQLLTF